MLYSFVLISAPDLCNGAKFNRHRMFFRTRADGSEKEIFDVIAINCNSRYDIPDILGEISLEYLAMQPTEENIKTAVWSTVCNAFFLGMPLAQYVIDTLAVYDIHVDENNCIYIPVNGLELSLAEHIVVAKMRPNK